MKKKKLFLLASLAALAMTSCSSFDEPAALDGNGMPLTRSGENAYPVYSETDLREALEDGETDITIASDITLTQALEINDSVSISGAVGKKITTSYPIVCNASASFSNLMIDGTTSIGTGVIELNSDSINVVMTDVNLTQNSNGQDDNVPGHQAIGIRNVTGGNSLKLLRTNINLTGDKYLRGINMYTENENDVELELDSCTITLGSTTNLANPVLYGRGLSFSAKVGTADGKPVIIKNSTIQGAYYVINSNGTRKVEVNVTGGTLDGRAAFNIWSPNFIANVDGTTLIGENNVSGSYESFANIVLNQGSSNSVFNLNGVTFKLMVETYFKTNTQYAISLRDPNATINLAGTITVIDSAKNRAQTYVSTNLTDLSGITVTQAEGYGYIGNEQKASIFLPETNQ